MLTSYASRSGVMHDWARTLDTQIQLQSVGQSFH